MAAISIEGPKGVGKTATALTRSATVHQLDDVGQRQIIEADPARLERGPSPILIDEWQRWQPSWDIVRRSVDADPTPGRFLLTGSASPAGPETHTGAGRIVPAPNATPVACRAGLRDIGKPRVPAQRQPTGHLRSHGSDPR